MASASHNTLGQGIGTLRLIGTSKQQIEPFPLAQIKRIRLLKRADGYSVQFALQGERCLPHEPTGKLVGSDVGLKAFYTDSDGHTVEHPRYLRRAEKRLKRWHRRVSRNKNPSKNRKKAIKRLAKGDLRVSRQRKDFAAKAASALVKSSDFIAYEDLKRAYLVKNRRLAKSISDASWGLFLGWLRYSGTLKGIPVIAVSPRSTTQDCSGCGERVKKTRSMRTHLCPRCGLVLDRDWNAALNIRLSALAWVAAHRTAGQAETGSGLPGRNASGQTASPAAPATGRGKRAG
jgi:putative transposase